jgi:acetyl esterase/lipase
VPVLAAAAVLATAAGCEWPEGTRYVDEVFGEVEVTRDIVYRTTTTHEGETVELKLDIYEPVGDTAAQRPAVFWMFGGGWTAGDRQQLSSYAEDSARRGYVGVTIDYRIRPGGGDLIAAAWDAYDDAVGAADWLKANASDYRIDPNAVVAAGYSAGAVNAMNLLYAPGTRGPEESPVAGGVAIAGLSFVSSPDEPRPPAIMHHGDADPIVPYDSGLGTCNDARDAGNTCDFLTYEGGDHFIAFTNIEEIQQETAHLIFERVLWPLGYRIEQDQAAA